jgi:DNA-binding beta-propeller fold protein YncE
MGEQPPAGWYPDPRNQQELRWWDGTQWGPLAPRATTVPTAAGHWPAEQPADHAGWTTSPYSSAPSPSAPGPAGRYQRGMHAAPGQPYADGAQYNRARQRIGNRAVIAGGAVLALALVAGGVVLATRSTGGSRSTGSSRSASSAPVTPSNAGATVLVVGSRSVIQINGATGTVRKSYAVHPTNSSSNGLNQGAALAMTAHGLTAYVIVDGGVVPVNLATHRVGDPIAMDSGSINAIAASPDGKTVYVASGEQSEGAVGTITPINTRVNQAGQPITVGMLPDSIAFAPDGKTALVADNDNQEVVPIDVTTGTAGSPIRVLMGGNNATAIVFTPDGKTAYVGVAAEQVTPINVATDTAEKPLPGTYSGMAITPDGKTLYVLGAGHEVTPFNTATNTAGAPLTIKAANDADEMLMSPDGSSLYILNGAGVLTIISTATNTVGQPIHTSSGDYPRSVAITPDGATLYISEHRDLIPFNTQSRAVGQPIKLSDFPDFAGGLVTLGTARALP